MSLNTPGLAMQKWWEIEILVFFFFNTRGGAREQKKKTFTEF